jgi:pimeloyl-ACP methyl ester carboxylesterase
MCLPKQREANMNSMTTAPRLFTHMQRQRISSMIAGGARLLLGLLALVGGLALVGASYEAIAAAGDATHYPPPGQLIDMDGHRLHLACTGDGAPTVVLVTGLGGSSLLWERVQPLLTSSARVCVYDRAGLGWSDASSGERTPTTLAAELHTMLRKADVPGPYVLVGASLGGKQVRLFAQQYPRDVAGLVLVDARHESIDAALTPDQREEGLASAQRDARLYAILGRLGIMRLFGATMAAGMSAGAAELPPRTRTLLMLQAARPHSADAMLREYIGSTADDDQLRAGPSLGAMPVIVLAADSSLAQAPGWGPAQEAQRQLSTNSRLVIVARSSHHIALDQPQAVADAIQQGAMAALTGAPLVQ